MREKLGFSEEMFVKLDSDLKFFLQERYLYTQFLLFLLFSIP